MAKKGKLEPLRAHPDKKDTALETTDVVLGGVANVIALTPVPGVKEAAELLLSVVELMKTIKDNKEAFKDLVSDAWRFLEAIFETTERLRASGGEIPPDLLDDTAELVRQLRTIESYSQDKVKRRHLKRIIYREHDLQTLRQYRERLVVVKDRFVVKNTMHIRHDLHQLVQVAVAAGKFMKVVDQQSENQVTQEATEVVTEVTTTTLTTGAETTTGGKHARSKSNPEPSRAPRKTISRELSIETISSASSKASSSLEHNPSTAALPRSRRQSAPVLSRREVESASDSRRGVRKSKNPFEALVEQDEASRSQNYVRQDDAQYDGQDEYYPSYSDTRAASKPPRRNYHSYARARSPGNQHYEDHDEYYDDYDNYDDYDSYGHYSAPAAYPSSHRTSTYHQAATFLSGVGNQTTTIISNSGNDYSRTYVAPRRARPARHRW
ncbi:hypothetical protein CC2G_000106 [Coprinopsis cinerea AmutBmut pab1-1]|nr:hypothetical protein CC2G_000106 [Coprinopsis cinerea AmutBmut pab1-1]